MRRGLYTLILLLLVACGGNESTPQTPNNPNPTNPNPTNPNPTVPGAPSASSISGLLIAPGTVGEPDPLPSSTPEVVPGEVIVKFKSAAYMQMQSLSLDGTRLQAVRQLPSADAAQLYRVSNLSQEETLQLADELNRRSDVEYAHPNWILRAFATPNDQYYGAQWHYAAMNLPKAWDIETGLNKPAVTIAVVDSGIVKHPDLDAQILAGYDFVSSSSVAGDGNGRDNDPKDEGGKSGYHGTHVAGTIGASTNNSVGVAGVNWNARIVPVRALGITGGGSFTDVFDGILWAVGESITGAPTNLNPARIVNLSLGADIKEACPSNIENGFRQLAERGIIVVVAAGNNGVNMATTFPGNCPSVITVGATGPTGERAPYSNFGSGVDVMAPGGDVTKVFSFNGVARPAGVLSTALDDKQQPQPNYLFYQGTSMATPHISGLVSLMLAKDPTLSYNAIVTRLMDTAQSLSASQCKTASDTDCGAGLVDAAAALGGTGGGSEPPPVTLTNLYAFALYCLSDTCFDSTGTKLFVDLDKSVAVKIEQTRSTQPYSVTNLPAGLYLMVGWQDIDNDGLIDNSDPFGNYPFLVPLNAGQQVSGIDVPLKALSPTTQSLASDSLSKQVSELAIQLEQ